MSWADDVQTSSEIASRPTRPFYVPPHLRDQQAQPPPAIIGGGGSPSRRSRRFSRASEPNPLQLADQLGELDINESAPAASESVGSTAINFDAYEDIPVETSGNDIPPPVSTFAEIDLGDALNANIKRCGYTKPTPVQRHSIPISEAGRDLMACAQTGSGKTAAFCFPIISGILRTGVSQQRGMRARIAYPQALILSPTRELSCQIHEEAKKFAYQTGVKVVVAYGGAPVHQQEIFLLNQKG